MTTSRSDFSSADTSSQLIDLNDTGPLPRLPNNGSPFEQPNSNNEPLEYSANFDDSVSISSSIEACYPLLSFGRDNNMDSPGLSPVSDNIVDNKSETCDGSSQHKRDSYCKLKDCSQVLTLYRQEDLSRRIESDSVVKHISFPDSLVDSTTQKRPPPDSEDNCGNDFRPTTSSTCPGATDLRSILKRPTKHNNKNLVASGLIQKRVQWIEWVLVRTYEKDTPEPLTSSDANPQPIGRVQSHLDLASYVQKLIQRSMSKAPNTSGSSHQTQNQHRPGTLQPIDEIGEDSEEEQAELCQKTEATAQLNEEEDEQDVNSSADVPRVFTKEPVGVPTPSVTKKPAIPNLSAYQTIRADHPSRSSTHHKLPDSHSVYQQHPRALQPYYGPPGPRIDLSLPDRNSSLRCYDIHTDPLQHRWYCTIDDREMNGDEAEERRDHREEYFERKRVEDVQLKLDLEYIEKRTIEEQERAKLKEQQVSKTAERLAREKSKRDADPQAYVPRVFTTQFTNLDAFARPVSSGSVARTTCSSLDLFAKAEVLAQKLVHSKITSTQEPMIRRCHFKSESFGIWKTLPDGREVKVFRQQENTPKQWEPYWQRHRPIQYEPGFVLNQRNLDESTGLTIIPVPLSNPLFDPNFAAVRVRVAEVKNNGHFGKDYVAEFSLFSITWGELRDRLQEHYGNNLPICAIHEMQRVDSTRNNKWLEQHNTFLHVDYPLLGYNFLSVVHGEITTCEHNRLKAFLQLYHFIEAVERGTLQLEANDY
ncbi:unnamed protein product [Caenorhabditis brenneri]